MTDTSDFKPDQDIVSEALADQANIEKEGRFNNSKEARRKQDTPFADETVDSDDQSQDSPDTSPESNSNQQ
jgi:hypothetical protein